MFNITERYLRPCFKWRQGSQSHRIDVARLFPQSGAQQSNLRTISLLIGIFYVFLIWCPNSSEASGLLDCHDQAMKDAGICDNVALQKRNFTVTRSLQTLKRSRETRVASLASADEEVLFYNLKACASPEALLPPEESVTDCVAKTLSLAQSVIHSDADFDSLLSYLRTARSVPLKLVQDYPDTFSDLLTSYLGFLTLRRDASGQGLSGSIEDLSRRHKFPAALTRPSSLDQAFFLTGRCRSSCFSSWRGSFSRNGSSLVFHVQSQRG